MDDFPGLSGPAGAASTCSRGAACFKAGRKSHNGEDDKFSLPMGPGLIEDVFEVAPRGQIVDLISISKRPATVEDRAVPGHWEGDLLSGSKNSYIATLVERQTRYVTLAKVANKDTQTVVSALIKQAKTIPDELCADVAEHQILYRLVPVPRSLRNT